LPSAMIFHLNNSKQRSLGGLRRSAKSCTTS
jgi:hypothetical protein